MPYRIIEKDNGEVKVINADTGRVLAKDTTRANAEAMIRLLKQKGYTEEEEAKKK